MAVASSMPFICVLGVGSACTKWTLEWMAESPGIGTREPLSYPLDPSRYSFGEYS